MIRIIIIYNKYQNTIIWNLVRSFLPINHFIISKLCLQMNKIFTQEEWILPGRVIRPTGNISYISSAGLVYRVTSKPGTSPHQS